MTETRTVKLVRRRDGVDAFGRKTDANNLPVRVFHLVDVAADLESSDRIWVVCGLDFAPGTLVEVPWIEALPHKNCLQQSPWPRRRIEADFLTANVMPGPEGLPTGMGPDALAILSVVPEVAASIAELSRIMDGRYGWARNVDGTPTWEYARSFKGALVGEKRFPRHHDLGLAPLAVEIVKPGVARIQSCGVLDGCPGHAVSVEDVPLDNVTAVKERLTRAEKAARAIDVARLCWCLIVGDCSARPMSDAAALEGEAHSDH